MVTGSSAGIGREIVLALARAGADVVAHGIKQEDAANEVLRECHGIGTRASFFSSDFSVSGAAREFAATVLREAGPVDIVVLNASLQIRRDWASITEEEAEIQMRTNFHASLKILQVLVPSMRKKQWGRILTVGSVQQVKPHRDMLVYAASKMAQLSLVLNLAKQLAPDGITVNNLAPGVIYTDRNKEALADQDYSERLRQAIPAGCFGEPRDCAAAAMLLCSEEGRYITGQDLFVDGGMSL